jgi:tetratricopeptide (TPR) repeat protein
MPLLVRSRIYLRKGDQQRALADCNAGLKVLPESAWGYATLAMILQKSANHEAAVRAATRAIQMAPEDPESYATRGRALLALKRYRSAIADVDHAVSLDSAMRNELANELAELRNRR